MSFNHKEYQKEYKLKNKEKLREYQKEWRLKNKEKVKEQQKQYRLQNTDKLNEYRREHFKTESGRKTQRIQTWKKRNVICDDWNTMYENFMNCKNCELCNIEFTIDNKKFDKVLDHDHISGKIRNIICRTCNNKLPKQL